MKRLWLDLGELGGLVRPSDNLDNLWQDHGMGLLRTILHNNNVMTEMFSLRSMTSWREVHKKFKGYDILIMNIRSFTFPFARKSAMLFKKVNPKGIVLVGGVHTSVALDEMIAVEEFDRICQGPGENIIVNLVKDPLAFPRIVSMPGAKSMAEWPIIDRTLWPKPHKRLKNFPWPLEPDIGWAPDPVATILTSRVCPWKCAFCNEDSYISNLGRKPVDRVIDELNYLDETYGPIGSVVIHDSMFFQHPKWLKEWLEKYPRLANHAWPYWASARSDCVRRWPDLFEAIVRETNWTTVSLGFESGSNRILKLLNKECTEEDNYFAIDLLNKIGDDLENMGSTPPKIFANIILAIPGETREDAFKTMRMVKRMHRAISCTAYYSPYPGSALGYQLIAEGKSLLTKYDYQRYPRGKKVQGVDYQFYSDLLAGKYDEEINQMCSKELINEQKIGSFPQPHCMYLFGLKNGKKKLAYGESPQDALDVLRIRLTDKEMEEIIRDEYVVINQCDIQKYVEKLG